MNSNSKKLLKQIVKEEVKLISEYTTEYPWTGPEKPAWDLLKSWGATPKSNPSGYNETILQLKMPWWWAPAKKAAGSAAPPDPNSGYSYPRGKSGLTQSSGDVLTFYPNSDIQSQNNPLKNLTWKLSGNSMEFISGPNVLGTIKKGKKPGEGEYQERKESKELRKQQKIEFDRWSAKEKNKRGDALADATQAALDILGFIPFYGDAIDLYNAWWYWDRGKKVDSVLTVIGAIPLVGSFVSVGSKVSIRLGTETGAYISKIINQVIGAPTGTAAVEVWSKAFKAVEGGTPSAAGVNKIRKAMAPAFEAMKNLSITLKQYRAVTKLNKQGKEVVYYVSKSGKKMSTATYKSMDTFLKFTAEFLSTGSRTLDQLAKPVAAAVKGRRLVVAPVKAATEVLSQADEATSFFAKMTQLGGVRWSKFTSGLLPVIDKISPQVAINLENEMAKRFAKIVKGSGNQLNLLLRTALLSSDAGKSMVAAFEASVNKPGVAKELYKLADGNQVVQQKFFNYIRDTGEYIFTLSKNKTEGGLALSEFLSFLKSNSKENAIANSVNDSLNKLIKSIIDSDNILWTIWKSNEFNILKSYASKPWALMKSPEGSNYAKRVINVIKMPTFGKLISNIYNELEAIIEEVAPDAKVLGVKLNQDDPDEKQSIIFDYIYLLLMKGTWTQSIEYDVRKRKEEMKKILKNPSTKASADKILFLNKANFIDWYTPGKDADTLR